MFKIIKRMQTFNRHNHSWTLPGGYDTGIKIYNCVSKKAEPLIVRNKEVVTWYTCGPTVYDSAHIGHASCYVKLDIIQRILRHHFKLNLVTCMNITDIDDKIIKKAQEDDTDFQEVSKMYEKEFWRDLNELNVPKPNIVLRVTENVPLIVNFIRKLESDGFAYRAPDGSVYFDSSKSQCPSGILQNIPAGFEESPNPYKKCPADFAMWKNIKSQHEPFFDSPWGKGRPGWHIECSAMASHVFGSNIDIHAGGLDLRFPHHENEEIQSCSFHGTNQWVNYWIHTGHLHLRDSTKMSKSLKNTVSIQNMLKETEPAVFRLLCAMSYYSKPMEFSTDLLATSRNNLNVYKNFFVTCSEITNGYLKPCLNNDVLREVLMNSKRNIHNAFCDDFNTPEAVQVLNYIVSSVNSMVHSSAMANCKTPSDTYYLLALSNLFSETLELFGINLHDSGSVKCSDVSDFVDLLVSFRQDVRNAALESKNKDILKLCDTLRDNLRKSGLNVKDHGKVSSWSR